MQIPDIENALKLPLPGRTAQHLMAPSYRPDYGPEEIAKFDPKIGGVLLLLDPRDSDIHVILTLRKEYPGTHGGQMSFPGGKKEIQDTDVIKAALRETQEEIGISPASVRVIGQLSELYIPPSNFLVYPAVGVLTGPASYQKQEAEVEEIVEIPLSFFLNKDNRSTTKIKIGTRSEIEVPAFLYQKYVIWGATAIILSEFITLLES